MLLKPDCIPCIVKMIISYIRKLTDDEKDCRELLTRFLRLPVLRGERWDMTSPEAIEPVMDMMRETFGADDPFQDIKEEENARALELYPWLQQSVRESQDPLFAAVNLAILGNRVDIMVFDRATDMKEVLAKELGNPIGAEPFEIFREKLSKAGRLLYLGDNSGEIVFDRLLIETINDLYDLQITFVARNLPALNDVTLREARRVEMDTISKQVCSNPF
jgi:uncharacterized protein with ATP-grasp and redox domains